MSHRSAKRLRKVLFPRASLDTLSATRVSRGTFLRSTTEYEIRQIGIKEHEWPLQVLFGKLKLPTYEVILKKSTPRGVLRQVTRRAA